MSQIKATIIADSISEQGVRITTFELEYHRYIHGELMTHRMFSRNAASSRAIPVNKVIDMVRTDPVMPTHWGKNQAGMQAKEELSGSELVGAKESWESLAMLASEKAENMLLYGLHKQVANRVLEPFQLMKTIVTATEYENFFWLRNHSDAQPEIKMLAEKMLEALECSTPKQLQEGEWHTPYYNEGWWNSESEDSLEDALAISSSCCAQVSYRKLDDSIEKARMVYSRLVDSKPVHASPFEHQAKPMDFDTDKVNQLEPMSWQAGCTHLDKNLNLWSGNFKGWIQHRQLIKDNVYTGEVV